MREDGEDVDMQRRKENWREARRRKTVERGDEVKNQ